mgnify:CR=1 FL=1
MEGAARQNYTGAPLDKEMDKTKAALKEHGKNLAAHIGAHTQEREGNKFTTCRRTPPLTRLAPALLHGVRAIYIVPYVCSGGGRVEATQRTGCIPRAVARAARPLRERPPSVDVCT